MISINGRKLNLGNYPDGTLLMTLDVTGDFFEVRWNYESDAELFALICTAKQLRRNNPSAKIHLFLPYIPHARMDRVKSSSDVFTLKYFSEIINSLGFDKVITIDPHSSVSEALLDRIEAIFPEVYIKQTLEDILLTEGEYPTLYYTDEGGQKRYSGKINAPSVYGFKKRDWNNGQILSTEIIGDSELIDGKNILVVDDIVSYGGTIYFAALKLKEMGCRKIYVYATHMENSILEEEKGKLFQSGLVEKYFTTDSIFSKRNEAIRVFQLREDLI